MKRSLTISAALLAAALQGALPVAAGDLSQLAAAAGLSEAEAAQMSLSEIHAYKINRESRADDRVTVSSREYPVFEAGLHRQLVSAAGLDAAQARGMSLSEVAAYKVNRNAGHDGRISVAPARSAGFDAGAHRQLVAAAGLTIEEAGSMSLAEVFRYKINREARGDERQVGTR